MGLAECAAATPGPLLLPVGWPPLSHLRLVSRYQGQRRPHPRPRDRIRKRGSRVPVTGISPSPHFSSDVSEPDYLRRSHKCTLVFLLCLLSLDLPHWGGHCKCPSSRNPPLHPCCVWPTLSYCASPFLCFLRTVSAFSLPCPPIPLVSSSYESPCSTFS